MVKTNSIITQLQSSCLIYLNGPRATYNQRFVPETAHKRAPKLLNRSPSRQIQLRLNTLLRRIRALECVFAGEVDDPDVSEAARGSCMIGI